MQDYIERNIDINAKIDKITVKQFDNDSRYLHVTITDADLPNDNKSLNLIGCAAALYVQPAGDNSGARVAYVSGEIADAENGVVTFLLPSGVTQVVGDYECEIWLYQGSGGNRLVLSSKPFVMTVEKSIRNNSAIEASSSFTALDERILLVDAALQTVEDVRTEMTEMAARTPILIDTAQDIQNLNPTVGQVYMTRGFYAAGDGGSTKFVVSSSAPDVPLYYAVNGVYVGIEKKSVYDARELGFAADGSDNTVVFNALHPCGCEIVFPPGYFAFSELLINKNNHIFTLSGFDAKTQNATDVYHAGAQTYFVPYESNQKYVIKIGGRADCIAVTNPDNNNPYSSLYFSGFTIRGIAFSDKSPYSSDRLSVTQYMVMIEACALISGNLDFRNSASRCLSFKNTWEHYWDFIIMRSVTIEPMTYDVHDADDADNEHPYANWKINALWDILPADTANNGNCSAIVVGLLDVEGVTSTVLCARPGSNMDSCTIDKIQVEGSMPPGTTGTVFAANNGALTTGINKYTNTNTKKLPLFAFNDSKGIIINSISLQKVGYQYFEHIHQISKNETQTCTYVHILLYGYGSVYIGSVMQSTTFHLFTLSASKTEYPTGKQFTIGSYVCDKTSLLPAVTSGVDYIYRVYTSSGTNVLHSTVQIYKNGVGLPTPKTLAFIQSSSGSDTYFPATPTNDRQYPCVRFHGSGYKKIAPKQMGCCDTLKIVAELSNARVTVKRYKAGESVGENDNDIRIAPVNDEAASMKRWELVMPTGVDYDSYEILYQGMTSNAYLELCSIAVE